MSSAVSGISNRNEQQADKKAPEEENFKTLNKEDQSIRNPNGGKQYHVNFSREVPVQQKIPLVAIEDGKPTFYKQVNSKTHIWNSMAQKPLIGDLIKTHTTHIKDNGHQSTSGDFKTLERDNNKLLTFYEGSVKSIKTDHGTNPTSKLDNSGKVPAGEYKTPHEAGNNTFIETMMIVRLR